MGVTAVTVFGPFVPPSMVTALRWQAASLHVMGESDTVTLRLGDRQIDTVDLNAMGRCGHRVLLSRWPHRTTADRSCEVKNLDFATEGGCASLPRRDHILGVHVDSDGPS
jgi:hypothetical protein